MNAKAQWIKDLEKREQEILLLRREQIAREGEVYQRELRLKIDQEALKAGYEALEKQKVLNQSYLAAMLSETEAIGQIKGKAAERAKSEALQKELDSIKGKEVDMLKTLLEKAVTALQVNIVKDRS